jgi:hypothetical protein
MKPKRILTLICISLLLSLKGFSQEESNNNNRLGIFLDIGGNSGGYSVNTEYNLFQADQYQLNARLGFGYLTVREVNFISIPFGINCLIGKQKHHIEIGTGASYIKGLRYLNIQIGNSNKYYSDEAIYFVPSIGYRYDKYKKGLFFKAYYSPLIVVYDFIDKEEFINDAVPDGIVFGDVTKSDFFNYFLGNSFIPEAKNSYTYFGASIGYRF